MSLLSLNRVTGWLQRSAANYQLLVKLAVKLRNQCNRVVAYSLCNTSNHELNGEAWLLRILAGKIHTIFDVGANEGDWLDCAIRNLASVQNAVAFEPSSSVCAALKTRFKAFSEVEIVQSALSDEAGGTEFYEANASSELSSLWKSDSASVAKTYSVRVSTAADECQRLRISQLDLLKIDTEGNDFYVLRGAEPLLRKQQVGIVQFEYDSSWIRSGCTLNRTVDYLNEFGYTVFVLKPASLQTFRASYVGEYFGYSNFVALSERFLPLVQ